MPKGELLMRGSYKVIIQNNRVQFKLTINRNLTLDYRLYPNTSHIHPYMYG